MKGAGSGRGGGEVRDLKSGVVGCGSGRERALLQTAFGKVLEKDCRLVVLHTPPPHTEIRTQNHNKDMDLNIKGFDTNQHTVEVGEDDTVEGLRRKVASAMGLPEDGFCMSFGDEAMGAGSDMTQLSAGDTIILTKTQKQEAIAELHALGVTDITAEKLKSVRDPEVACLLLQAEVATVIPNSFLACTSLTRLDLSAESIVTRIGHSFLINCTSLTSIDLSGLSNLTQVGAYFLEECSSLTILNLSPLSNVTQIETCFLNGCTSLTTIDLSPLVNVMQVGTWFLANCSSLTTLYLSPLSNVTSIDLCNWANAAQFAEGCTSLTSIYLSGCSSVVSKEVRKDKKLSKLVVETRPKRSRDESPEQSQKRRRHAQ